MQTTSVLNLKVHSTLPMRMAAVAVVFLTAFALAFQSKPESVKWLAYAFVLVAGVALYRLRSQPYQVVIKPEEGELWLHYRPWLAKPSLCLRLAPFKVVRSFLRGAPLPVVIVELATEEDLPRAVHIGEYEEASLAKAEGLRAGVAKTGIFQDYGYLGEFLERRAEEVR